MPTITVTRLLLSHRQYKSEPQLPQKARWLPGRALCSFSFERASETDVFGSGVELMASGDETSGVSHLNWAREMDWPRKKSEEAALRQRVHWQTKDLRNFRSR